MIGFSVEKKSTEPDQQADESDLIIAILFALGTGLAFSINAIVIQFLLTKA